MSLRSELLERWAIRAGVSKCQKSQARKVSRHSKVSLQSEVLNGCVNRTVEQSLDDTWPELFHVSVREGVNR